MHLAILGDTIAAVWVAQHARKIMDTVTTQRQLQLHAYVFEMTIPVIGVCSLVYAGIGDAAFGIFGVIGRRLPQKLRRLLRRLYCALQVVAMAVLHASMATSCYAPDLCAEKPMRRQKCLGTVSIALATFWCFVLAERAMNPMLKIPDSQQPGFCGGARARVFNAAAVLAAWLCVAEGETLGILLMLAATARRALAPAPRVVGTVYVLLYKIYAVFHLSWVLSNQCGGSGEKAGGGGSRRASVAVVASLCMM